MLSIKPPHFFNRMPREITLAHHYKASEFYNFILFYSLPVLKNFLPPKFLQHWSIFVRALFLLLGDTIQKKQLTEADMLLKLFVKQIPSLYSDRESSYNVHQLQHFVLMVERWGPLLVTSTFRFENFNGFLAHSVHGTKHLGREMANNLLTAQGAQILRSQVNAENIPAMSSDEITTFDW